MNSTQPQGPVITAHKRLANNTHQSQWQIISPPHHNNTSITKSTLITIITQSPEKDKSWSHNHKYSTIQQTAPEHRVLSSQDAGHRDWWNVRKNNLQNTAKEPEKPTTTTSEYSIPGKLWKESLWSHQNQLDIAWWFFFVDFGESSLPLIITIHPQQKTCWSP